MGYEQLGYAIVERAVLDYRALQSENAETLVVDGAQRISRKKIEKFFLSKWCQTLLSEFGLTGKEILETLKSEDNKIND